MASNEEYAKSLETLEERVKSMQNELVMLKRRVTHSGSDPQPGVGTQYSSTDIAGLVPPPKKNPDWKMR